MGVTEPIDFTAKKVSAVLMRFLKTYILAHKGFSHGGYWQMPGKSARIFLQY